VENGCEIDFCVKAGAFSTSGLPPVRQPPFMQISTDGLADSLSYSISADGEWDGIFKTQFIVITDTYFNVASNIKRIEI
jgi:hypothetical protein